MKRKMLLITAFLAVALLITAGVFIVTKSAVMEAAAISVGVTLYHFVMRLLVGAVVNLIMKNEADYNNIWFREKRLENKLYRLIGVRRWKKYIPSYSPDMFDISKRTTEEIIGATCQAEIVHEIIMVLSLVPIALIPVFGGAAAMIITSALSLLIDLVFVILQRYNRPRLIRVMGRYQKGNKSNNVKQ